MTLSEQRYMELIYRKVTLNEILDKIEKENSSKAMLMFAKAFDETIEEKQTGYIVLLKRWIAEIDEELKRLDNKVFEEFVEKDVQKVKDELNK